MTTITHMLDWQTDCCDRIANGHRFPRTLVTGPNGSGKTLIALVWSGLASIVMDGRVTFHPNPHQRVIFTAPIKALSNERYRQLRDLGLEVGILTGDVRMNPDAPILCMTQEVYAQGFSKLKNQRVVIDEVHYMFWDSDRFRPYADGIYNTHPESHLLLLSATISDPAVKILEKLAPGLYRYDHCGEIRYQYLFEPQDPVALADAEKEVLIFLFSPYKVEMQAAFIAEATKMRLTEDQWLEVLDYADMYGVDVEKFSHFVRHSVGIYHGSLLLKERMFFDRLFRQHLVTSLVATNGLALGVNLPAEYVLFGQLAKQYASGPIEKSNFLQMSGRAGRPGFHNSGFVGYCSKPLESRGFKTAKLFSRLVESPLEEPHVPLELNIRELLQGVKTIDEEYEFLHQLNPSITVEAVQQRWQGIKNVIKGGVRGCTRDQQQRRDIRERLAQIYTPELSIPENINYAAKLIINGYIDVNGMIDRYRGKKRDGKLMRELLIYLKFFRPMGEKVINLQLLIDFINEVDSRYLSV